MKRIAAAAGLLVALAVPTAAWGHAERPAFFPDYPGSVPSYDSGPPDRVVCKSDSREQIEAKVTDPTRRQQALDLVASCEGTATEPVTHYEHIQQAVNAAGNDERIV